MNQSDIFVDQEILNQANRVAAEACFNIAQLNLQRGYLKDAQLFLQRAAKLSSKDQPDIQDSSVSSFSCQNDAFPEDFADFLTKTRNYNNPINCQDVDKSCPDETLSKVGRSDHDARECFEDNHRSTADPVQKPINDCNQKIRLRDRNSRPFSSRGESIEETIRNIQKMRQLNNNERLNAEHDTKNKRGNGFGIHKNEPTQSTDENLSQQKNETDAFQSYLLNWLENLKGYLKTRLSSCTDRLKAGINVLKSWSLAVVWKILQILLLFASFFFIVLTIVFSVAWLVIKTVIRLIVFLAYVGWKSDVLRDMLHGLKSTVCFILSDLLGFTYFDSQCHVRLEDSCSWKRELPKTSKEAINHLVSCSEDDPYEALFVHKSSSQEDIRKNYRKLALLVHPDKHETSNLLADKAIKILNGAYAVLGDEEKREKLEQEQHEYDEFSKKFDEDFNDFMNRMKYSVPCQVCEGRHAIVVTDRDARNARYCDTCYGYHHASEGDVWVESSLLGTKRLYLCLEMDYQLKVFSMREWGHCQSYQFGQIPPNYHRVLIKMQQQKSQKQTRSGPYKGKRSRKRKARR